MIERNTTGTVKKTVTILCGLFLLLFIKYKPYEQALYGDGFLKDTFTLYYYIIDITFGWVHESGHGVCYIARCPDFLTALSGTVFQLLFPFLLGYISKRRGNIFGFYIGLFFVGFSMQYTAWYVSTAREGLFLPASKSFLGVDGYHDFYTILSTLGLLNYDYIVSVFVKISGYILMFYACFKMAITSWFEDK